MEIDEKREQPTSWDVNLSPDLRVRIIAHIRHILVLRFRSVATRGSLMQPGLKISLQFSMMQLTYFHQAWMCLYNASPDNSSMIRSYSVQWHFASKAGPACCSAAVNG